MPASSPPRTDAKTIEHGGALAAAIAEFGGRRQDWLDLSTGINPCPPPLPDVPRHVWQGLPDADLMGACLAAARRFHGFADPAALLAAPGVQALIQLLPSLRPGAEAMVLGPTYGEYAHVFHGLGQGASETDSIETLGDAGIAVVVNPNNPTGRIVPPARLGELAHLLAAKGGLLVVDEAFCDLTPQHSLAQSAGMPGLLVLKSFGKFFGLAGLRLGFAAGTPADVALLQARLGPWAVSGAALSMGAALMTDIPTRARLEAGIQEAVVAQRAVLKAAALDIIADAGLFQLVACDDARALQRHLARNHILTRAFNHSPRWLRFGLCPDAEARLRLAAALHSRS
jgi:cobalamin biosynthesis protein CobC